MPERLRSHSGWISSMACLPEPLGSRTRRNCRDAKTQPSSSLKLLPLPHFSSLPAVGGRGPALAVPAFAGPANCVAQAEILSRAVDFFRRIEADVG